MVQVSETLWIPRLESSYLSAVEATTSKHVKLNGKHTTFVVIWDTQVVFKLKLSRVENDVMFNSFDLRKRLKKCKVVTFRASGTIGLCLARGS